MKAVSQPQQVLESMNILKSVVVKSLLLCAVFLLFGFSGAQGQASEPSEGDVFVYDLEFSGESLQEAATRVSSQTGYQIVIKKEWADIPVNGQFDGVTVEKFFQRVLRGQNLSIISSVEKKVFVVRLFGDKKLDNLLSISGKPTGSSSSGPEVVDVDIMDGQKISEIKELYAQYEEEERRFRNDPNRVDPMDGQSISEIQELQAEYEADYEKWKKDPNRVDPIDGQKISEIRKLQAEYEAEVERWKNDPEAVDPMDGQKLSEIRRIYAEYEAEYERWKNDPNRVDPMDGQPISEIQRKQAEYEANK